MWVPNPNPYKWGVQELDTNGIPHVKGRIVTLERDDKQKKFHGQEAVDEAWANGWHDTNRPETADVVREDKAKPKPKAKPKAKSKPKSKSTRPKTVKDMNKAEKIKYGETLDLELHDDMSHEEMDLDIKTALAKLEDKEK